MRSARARGAGPRRTAELAELAHHFAEGAPLGEPGRAVEVNLLAAELRQRARVRRGEPPVPGRARARPGSSADRADFFSGSATRATGRGMPRRRCRRSGRRPIARGLPDESSSRSRLSASRRRAGDPPSLTPARWACWRKPTRPPAGRRPDARAPHRRARSCADSPRRHGLAAPRRARPRSGCHGGTGTSRGLGDARSGVLVPGDEHDRGGERHAPRGVRFGGELDDPDLAGEAISWRIPPWSRSAITRRRATGSTGPRRARRSTSPSGSTSPSSTPPRSSSATAISTRPESAAMRSREWGRHLTGRDASGVYGLQMFGLRREQGDWPTSRRSYGFSGRRATEPGVRAFRRLSRARHGRGGAPRLHRLLTDGIDKLRPSLWTRRARVPDRCLRRAARRIWPSRLPGAGTVRRHEHDGRAPRLLLRGYRSLPRDERHVLGDWERAESRFEAALALNPASAREHGSRTPLTSTRGCCSLATRTATASVRRKHLGDAAGLGRTIGMPTLPARIESFARASNGRGAPRRSLAARSSRSSTHSRAGARTATSAATHISEHTAANHVRSILRKTESANRTEAALRASSRARSGMSDPLRSTDAALCDRARVCGAARAHNEDVRLIEEVNADEGVSWLFSFTRPTAATYCLYEAPSAERSSRLRGGRTFRRTRSLR